MVQVLDNKLIRLEIMPGTQEFQEAQKIAQEQGIEAAMGYAEQAKGKADGAVQEYAKTANDQFQTAQSTLESATQQLPEEQKKQAQGALKTAANAGTGVVTTLGG